MQLREGLQILSMFRLPRATQGECQWLELGDWQVRNRRIHHCGDQPVRSHQQSNAGHQKLLIQQKVMLLKSLNHRIAGTVAKQAIGLWNALRRSLCALWCDGAHLQSLQGCFPCGSKEAKASRTTRSSHYCSARSYYVRRRGG